MIFKVVLKNWFQKGNITVMKIKKLDRSKRFFKNLPNGR